MPKTTNQKEQIVKAALRLFAKQGYGSASVRQIAKAAKVSPSLMYNFFNSKEDVLKEIVLRGFDDIKTSLGSYKTVTDGEKAIEMHIISTFDIIKRNSEFWRLLHTIRLQDKVLDASKELFDEMIRFVTSTFIPVFKKLGYPKPELEAVLFLSQIDGLALLYLQNPSLDIKKISHHLIRRYKK